jgi:hypothetical protein
MNKYILFITVLIMILSLPAAFAAESLQPLLKTLQAVGSEGAGQKEAAEAWQRLAQADAAQLPTIIAGLDNAGPLAANWIATAVDAIADRQLQRGGKLPEAELERLVLDTRHAPKTRALAYQWLSRVDASAPRRLLSGMLNDASGELRRDSIEQFIEETDALAAAGKTGEATARFREALNAARDVDQISLLAGRLRKLGQTVDLARQLGFIVRWKLIGPFDNTAEKGYDIAYAPEKSIDLRTSYISNFGIIRWIDYASKDDFGLIDLNTAIGEDKGAVAYAATDFYSAKKQAVQFRMTSLNAVKLWLNGQLIDEHKVYHLGSQLDHYTSRAVLLPGRNAILVKICQNEQTQDWAKSWAFQLRVCGDDGAAVHSIEQKNE